MTGSLDIGTYAGSTSEATASVDAMERWLGRPLDVQHVFTSWDVERETTTYLFEDVLPSIWTAGRTPMVTWEPFTPVPASTPDDILDRILAGDYDEYIRTWGRHLASGLRGPDGAGDRQLVLRLAHEANGDWYPWSPEDDGAGYVSMWRHVRDLVAEVLEDEARVQWVWSVNHVDVGRVVLEELFPGDDYVDLLGVDGFNWGATREWSTWQSPAAVFGEAFSRLDSLAALPVWITEVGCTSATENGVSPRRKNEWIETAFEWFTDGGVETVCWFDVDKETDWAVFGGRRGTVTWQDDRDGSSYTTYPAFREALANDGGRISDESC
jgi:beta-mannanase